MVKRDTEEKKKSSFRNKKEKPIVYPVLQECMKLEKQLGWQELFNNMSRGVCPKGIIIQNGTVLGSLSKKNNIKYNFLEDQPETIISTIKSMFSNLVNIQSDNDKRNREYDAINELYNEYKNMEWRTIKKKAIKEMLIQNFVLQLKTTHNLSQINAIRALECINNALNTFKTHKNEDVNYADGSILSIDDIKVVNGCVVNLRNITDNVDEDLTDEDEEVIIKEKKTTSLKELWDSYLNTLSKV